MSLIAVKGTAEFNVKFFKVPTRVATEQGVQLKLSMLDPGTLGQLCNQFRADVFAAAGKKPLPVAYPSRG